MQLAVVAALPILGALSIGGVLVLFTICSGGTK